MTLRYVGRRLLHMLAAAVGVLVITFLIVHAFGEPALLGSEGMDPADIRARRHELGLDRPLLDQFVSYASHLARGDLGRSYEGPPVVSLIAERLWPTVLLMLSALLVSTPVGIALGLVAAKRPPGAFDLGVSGGTLVGYAVPGFWLAQLVVLAVILPTGLLPVEGMTSARGPYTGWAHVVDVGRHLVAPALVLAASEVALLARLTRTGVRQQLGSDYVRAARGRGVSPADVVSRHALPNALLPIVTVIGGRLGFMLSGAVLIESVFAWPGLGTLLVQSARGGDRPIVLGMVLLITATTMVANLLTDLVCARLDPRVQLQ